MDERIQELIDHTQKLCGLGAYTLKSHHIFHNAQDGYIFSTEWQPNEDETEKTNSNPPGTAVIGIDFHTKTLKSLVLVKDVSYIETGILPGNDRDQLLDWIEEETEMTYGRQFQLIKEDKNRFEFRASIDNLPVAPTGKIDIKFNDKGQLVLFSVHGLFPDESDMAWEPFSLTSEDTESFARDSLTLVDIPVEKKMAWIPVYSFEEQFITNDGKSALSAQTVNEHPVYIHEDHILEWQGEATGAVDKVKIEVSTETTLEQALSAAEHADCKPISKQLEQACLQEAARVMQLEYPEESGKWKATSLYRQHGHLFTVIRPADPRMTAVRKITLVFDESGKVINIVDNKFVFQLLSTFKEADEPQITADQAYDLLKNHIETEPVYVLDRESGKYHIHGRLHCPYAVNAVTGELLQTKEIM
ncbi:hypothetical protein QR721_11925 [Aciduricibacillus chroicocephali]|uniref:DUF4901 domain-containing protein n=1 Tax=Aciduricibacillus chroicocephali TaxID=3054939 RepID=A0ABY9KUV9_9BACI|nr:hypothetical protein QR721_11925 [Bacillaceae bacterium 44XB]